MALISLVDVSLALGGPLLFDGISLQVESGERVALLGRNGVGKTTLMKVIAGRMKVDKGDINYQKGIKIAHLPQEVPADLEGSVFDIVLSGLPERVKLLGDFHHLHHRLQTEHTPQLMTQLDRLQEEMDRTNGWETEREIEEAIARMHLDPESRFESLSGGQKRKALLAKALVLKPEILLLDEPTNHLDIESIDWLEGVLKSYPGTVFFVTHDRMFMTRLATKIVELDRGKLYVWTCDYPTFLERKKLAMHVEAKEWEQFDKKLAQEEIWIRQGIKARRTRNEGRVRALERLREEKKAQRQVLGKVRMKAQEAERSGAVVTKADHVSLSFGEKCVIRDFSARVMRGDKIGVIGPNGSGKTTLLRVLLGELAPQSGSVTLGTRLEIAYYDQLREQLDEEKSVAENIAGETDTVTVNGRPRHIMGYLQEFLFSPDRARTKVKVLSGGERNRLLLARLFTRTSNLLVMDEPTNDLDVETLELLEELLVDYSGTLLLVSHDREFLNNVVTSTIVLEGNGVVYEHPGGYDDWVCRRKDKPAEVEAPPEEPARRPSGPASPPKGKKFSQKDQKELNGLPALIEKLDAEQAQILEKMANPNFFKDTVKAAEGKARLSAIQAEIEAAYERWEFLEKWKADKPSGTVPDFM
ncbi:MAG TPA: ATP-binding cassette domain-containing protein [Candidatus Eisenbacteria bacterium]|nr:ATP-binding cassette domain-containing protein [Candidatus Eisenbacteria bacterium]